MEQAKGSSWRDGTSVYLSSSVSFFQIPDSLKDLAQRVTPIDDPTLLSGLEELPQNGQILFLAFASSPPS
jgi:hypothetical protein